MSTMPPWTNWVQVFANFATIITVAGVIVAYRQLHAGLKGQREATALGIWKDYLHLALQYPKLAAPQPFMTGAGRGTTDFETYEWFVSAMLFACEQIVALQPDDRQWRETVISQLRYHKRYLQGPLFHKDHYSPALGALIDEVIQEPEPPSAA